MELDAPSALRAAHKLLVLHVYIVDVHVHIYTCTLCILVMTHTCTYNIFMCEYSFLYCETVPEVIEADVYAHIRYADLADELKLVELQEAGIRHLSMEVVWDKLSGQHSSVGIWGCCNAVPSIL